MYNRRLSKRGSITLPRALRLEYRVLDDTNYSITFDKITRSWILTPVIRTCKLCGNEIHTNNKVDLCSTCIEEVKEMDKT